MSEKLWFKLNMLQLSPTPTRSIPVPPPFLLSLMSSTRVVFVRASLFRVSTTHHGNVTSRYPFIFLHLDNSTSETNFCICTNFTWFFLDSRNNNYFTCVTLQPMKYLVLLVSIFQFQNSSKWIVQPNLNFFQLSPTPNSARSGEVDLSLFISLSE